MTRIESRHRAFTLALLIGIASLAACSTTHSTAGLTTWNQGRVTQLAQQIREATNAWFVVLNQQGGGTMMGGEAGGLLGQNAVALQQQSAALAAHLEAGRGFQETVDSYGDLRELMDDADEHVDQTDLEDPTQAVWTKLSGLMTQITPYYDTRPFGS
jgi:hypothetical protein